jgi:uncharacterized protein (UPF0332 family)
MSNFLQIKSDNNVKASQTLLNQDLCASSVHCAYYACVQYMLHILYTKQGMTEESIHEDQKEGSNELEGGYHVWLIYKFELLLLQLRGDQGKTARTFASDIGQLKGLRTKADYKNVEITAKQAKRAYETSEAIIKILKEKLDI